MKNEAEWIERQLPYHSDTEGVPESLTDDQRRCFQVLASITHPSGLYNLVTPTSTIESINFSFGEGISVLIGNPLATYDLGQLTSLVLAAHQHLVRVEICPWLPHHDERRARFVAAETTRQRQDWDPNEEPVQWDDPMVGSGIMEIRLFPRESSFTATHRWAAHPTLTDLAARCLELEKS